MPTDEKFDRMIDRYLDGKLTPNEAAEFHALVADKPELADLLDAERLIRQQLVAENIAKSTIPPSETILSYLAATPGRRSKKLVYGLAAALLVMLLAMLLWPVSPATNRNIAPQVQDTAPLSPVVSPVTPIVRTDSVSAPQAKAYNKLKHKPSGEEETDLDAHLNKPKVYIKDPHIR